MATKVFYTIGRKAVTDIRYHGQLSSVPKLLDVIEGDDPLSKPSQQPEPGLRETIQAGEKQVRLMLDKRNQKILPSLINLEKSLFPFYVLNIYLEDATLKFFDKKVLKTQEILVSRLPLQSTDDELSLKTALEYSKLVLDTVDVEKTAKTKVVSGEKKDTEDNNPAKKSGLLTFITRLTTFRQKEVPQSGFANTTGKPVEPVSVEAKPSVSADVDLGKKEEGKKPGAVEESTVVMSSAEIPGPIKSDSNDPGHNSTLKPIGDESSKEVPGKVENVPSKDDAKVGASATNLGSSKEFLKYQTVTREPPPSDPRPEAEMKECSVIMKDGSLMDAQSLIEFNKTSMAPRSLMSMKEYVEYQEYDYKSVAWLQRYKAIRMREIAYHHAQIKKHRKTLLELMFKTPFQIKSDAEKQVETAEQSEPVKRQEDSPQLEALKQPDPPVQPKN